MSKIDIKRLDSITNDVDNETSIIKESVDKIVNKYTADLDDLMKEINDVIIYKEDTTDATLAKYFLELTNAYYFISSKCEILGLYEDIAKTKAKLAYNNAYNDSKETTTKLKQTVAELTSLAENATIEESVTSNIYSRSFKIIKIKLDAASTMISTISKIISSHMTEANLNNLSASNNIGV